MAVSFHKADIAFRLLGSRELGRFIELQVEKLAKRKACFTYVLCSDDYLLQINKTFLAHDNYTDIVTFPLSDDGKLVEAELYISIDRVRENAGIYDTSFAQELRRVVFHGALHLLGYKDKTKAEAKSMRAAENEWLDEFALYLFNQKKIK